MPKSSKILAIDTATDYIFLSLVVDGVEVGHAYQNDINNHAVTIMPLLDEILKTAEVKLNELTGVIVGIGPGSYTGVRIGVSIAKMIGYLNGIPVQTVSTLALIASGSEESRILSYIDARRGNAFLACFEQDHGVMNNTVPDSLANAVVFQQEAGNGYVKVTEGRPDILKVLRSHLLRNVENIHELVPNYLQITEAECNKGKK